MSKFILALCLAILTLAAHAKEAIPASDDPVLEARVIRITSELRCLVCQNQTIADSHAGLAIDLRNQVREMLQRGDTDQQVLDFMTARYGDFVLYRPPLKPATMVLWLGPAVMGLFGIVALALVLRRRSRMPPENFDPDEAEATPLPPQS
jgi:cytochrome c-type biogenesis protein CcmH